MTNMTTSEAPRCDWCGRVGHVEADHPLPNDHPDYDGFYDATDNELYAMLNLS